jgi:hypothetical protein
VFDRPHEFHAAGARLAGYITAAASPAYLGIGEGSFALQSIILFHGNRLELAPFHADFAAFAPGWIDRRDKTAFLGDFYGKAAAVVAVAEKLGYLALVDRHMYGRLPVEFLDNGDGFVGGDLAASFPVQVVLGGAIERYA